MQGARRVGAGALPDSFWVLTSSGDSLRNDSGDAASGGGAGGGAGGAYFADVGWCTPVNLNF